MAFVHDWPFKHLNGMPTKLECLSLASIISIIYSRVSLGACPHNDPLIVLLSQEELSEAPLLEARDQPYLRTEYAEKAPRHST